MESVLREGKNGVQGRERARELSLGAAPSALPRAQGRVLTVSRQVDPPLEDDWWDGAGPKFKYQTAALPLAAEALAFLTPGKEPQAEEEDQVCGRK